jgi:hypothetical protein
MAKQRETSRGEGCASKPFVRKKANKEVITFQPKGVFTRLDTLKAEAQRKSEIEILPNPMFLKIQQRK